MAVTWKHEGIQYGGRLAGCAGGGLVKADKADKADGTANEAERNTDLEVGTRQSDRGSIVCRHCRPVRLVSGTA